jgi:rhamnogalacturonan endolyase
MSQRCGAVSWNSLRLTGLAMLVFMIWGGSLSAQAQDRSARLEKALGELRDPSSSVRERAAVELVKLAPDVGAALPALTAALSDSFQPVRWNAAKALGMVGAEARSAAPALAQALKLSDWSGSAQVMAAWALGRMGPAAAEAVPALVAVLGKERQAIVRAEVVRTLAAIGPAAKAALPALTAALADENGFVRCAAATALWQVGQDSVGVSGLIEALQDPRIVGTRLAADALAEMGPGAKAAAPALAEALRDPAPCARVAAARALWWVARDTRGVPALMAGLTDPAPEVQNTAAETLRLIARETQEPVKSLNAALQEYERRQGAVPEQPRMLVFEAEDWTGPAAAIVKDKDQLATWKLATAFKGMSRNTVLVSPSVLQDRATPEEGAPVLHTHVTGIPNGRYAVTVSGYRPLGISTDGGATWRRLDGDPTIGTFDIRDGTFDLWVDDRYAHTDAKIVGPSYYDTLTFTPTEPSTVATVQDGAKERVRERLSRGVQAAWLADGGVYINWRLLEDDPAGVAFDVYRHEKGAPPQRLNPQPLTRTTDFLDRSAPVGKDSQYSVRLAGQARDRVRSPVVTVAAADPPYTSIKFQGNYQAYQVGIADLDGDGRFDYVIKQPAYGIWNGEYLWHRSTETYKLEAYAADGTFLWRYDMGWGIELGPWHSPFVVYDLDGDGRAEVACKAADADPRDAAGRIETGSEYLVVLDGRTGKLLCRTDWPSRNGFTPQYQWLNLMAVAYLDGKTPCLIVERGTYGLQKVDALRLRAGRLWAADRLERVWNWNNLGAGKPFWGQGAHTLRAADLDEDGCDEVILGSSVLDHHGVPLWSTGYGHVDQCFVGDIDPARSGLEVFYTVESPRAENGACLVEARSGAVIWGLRTPTYHLGFGLVADLDATHPGCECLAEEDPKGDPKGRNYEGKAPGWVFSASGEILAESTAGSILLGGSQRAAYWDADVQREVLDRGQLRDYQGATYPPRLEGDPLVVGDLTGDWREEIVTALPGELRLYSTRIPASDRRVCLMQDPVYRLGVSSNSQAYFSLPQTRTCLSAATVSLAVSGLAACLSPGAANPCTVVVVAPLSGPVTGTLRLEAGAGATVTPATVAVDLAPGAVGRYAFVVSPAAPSPRAGRGAVPISVTLAAAAGDPTTVRCELPVIEPPLAGVPLVEAEDFTAQVGGAVKIRADKIGVAGKAFSHWTDKGHRLSWQIEVPQAGRYHLVLRGSCEKDAARQLFVDDKALPGAARVRFPATGGYGGTAIEWRNLAVVGDDGQLAVLELAAGSHRITMDIAEASGLNLDQLALLPVPAP